MARGLNESAPGTKALPTWSALPFQCRSRRRAPTGTPGAITGGFQAVTAVAKLPFETVQGSPDVILP